MSASARHPRTEDAEARAGQERASGRRFLALRLARSVLWGVVWATGLAALALFSGAAEEFIYVAF